MSLAHHHDGITGTAKQHVADDYNMRIAAGANIKQVRAEIRESVSPPSTPCLCKFGPERHHCMYQRLTYTAIAAERQHQQFTADAALCHLLVWLALHRAGWAEAQQAAEQGLQQLLMARCLACLSANLAALTVIQFPRPSYRRAASPVPCQEQHLTSIPAAAA